MRTASFLFFLLLSVTTSGQLIQDLTGRPYMQKNADEYEGSPMLFSSWVKADVIAASGAKYTNMLINFDLVEDLPVFLKEDKTFTFSDEINEFTITDGITQLKYKRGNYISPEFSKLFIEVMSDSLHIIKKYSKALVEVPTYATANKRYRYAETVSYFAFLGGDYKKITLTKENARQVFAKKWTETEAYANTNNLSYKKEEGWRKLIQFYQVVGEN